MRLIDLAGRPDIEVEDEHSRFELYQAVLDDESWRPVLLTCLKLEPVEALTTSVLGMLLVDASPGQRIGLVASGPVSGQAFLMERAHDLEVLEALSGPTPGEVIAQVTGGSDWLQRRVAESTSTVAVLQALADNGRTRRVRNAAVHRMQALGVTNA